jgi:2-dehydropantoate 2-reductase
MNVVVFGAGSLGSLVGGLLARVHDVTLVGRDPHVRAVREGGLRVVANESAAGDSFEVHPRTTTDGVGLTADLAVVTVKSFDTAAAAADLATGEFGAALSLQNGMGNEEILADRLPCPILAGTTSLGAHLSDPGVVEWRGGGEVALGAWHAGANGVGAGAGDVPAEGDRTADTVDGRTADHADDCHPGRDDERAADRAAEAFRAAGIEAAVDADIRARLWEKLAVNAAINPTTALLDADNGAVLSPEAAGLVEPVARETARVARAEGVDLADEEAIDAVERVARATAANRSSMRQDVAAGRRTEIDSISGHVVERADRRDLPVPVNRTLLALVRSYEADWELR